MTTFKARVMVRELGKKRMSCKEWIDVSDKYLVDLVAIEDDIKERYSYCDRIHVEVRAFERGCEWVLRHTFVLK